MEDYFIRLGQIYYSKLEINSSFRENIIKVGIKGTSCVFAYFAQSKQKHNCSFNYLLLVVDVKL